MKIELLKNEMNNEVEGLIAKVNTLNESTTRDGQPYASMNLTDDTGSVTARWWNALPEAIVRGGVYKFRGVVNEYNSRLQFIVKDFEVITDPEITAMFFESAPKSLSWIMEKLSYYQSLVTDQEYKVLVDAILTPRMESFLQYPAATQNHHAYLQGLSYHTVTMCQVAESLLPIYPFVDASLLYAGILLHDVAKTVELSEAKSPEYTTQGKLLGHLVLGAQWVQEAASIHHVDEEKALLLQHLIISHHGRREWGAAQVPQTVEAELLYFIDNLDSKMESARVYLDEVDEKEWTKRIPVLDGNSLYKHKKNS
jgi:3'-5' exoribonuclease